jgi:hypothetical protein
MTISEEKHEGAVKNLQDIRKFPKAHDGVCVVPKKSMKTFQCQNNLGDIPQFPDQTFSMNEASAGGGTERGW